MKNISIIGMPMDLGQLRRGVDMGPSAIRYAGIENRLQELNHQVDDLGDIEIGRSTEQIDKETGLRNLDLIAEKTKILADQVNGVVKKEHFLLF